MYTPFYTLLHPTHTPTNLRAHTIRNLEATIIRGLPISCDTPLLTFSEAKDVKTSNIMWQNNLNKTVWRSLMVAFIA